MLNTIEWKVMTVICHLSNKNDRTGGVDIKLLQCFPQNHKMDFCLICPHISIGTVSRVFYPLLSLT